MISVMTMEHLYIASTKDFQHWVEFESRIGWAWWLMPGIPALWEAEGVDHLRSGVPDQLDQRGETLPLPNKQKTKLVRHGGARL